MDKKVGQKFDSGKPQYSLLPLNALEEQVKVLTFGAEKYTPGGWKYVEDAEKRYSDAALRHITSYLKGEELDTESGLHHLAHAQCCISFILELRLTK